MARFSTSLDVLSTLRDWAVGLKKLTFSDNFAGYEWEGEIDAGETVKITHPLKVIPTRFVVTNAFLSSTPVIRPDSPTATVQFFYLTSASNFRGKVLILP